MILRNKMKLMIRKKVWRFSRKSYNKPIENLVFTDNILIKLNNFVIIFSFDF